MTPDTSNDRETTASPEGARTGGLDGISRPRRLAFVVATILALFAVWFGGLELAIRVLDIGPEINALWAGNYRLSEDPGLRYELVPDSRDGRDRINRHGMRDRDYALAKPPNTFRVAVVGDSIAFGLWVPAQANFSSRLESHFERFFTGVDVPKIEVLNFGVTGYSFSQILQVLRTRVIDFDPDLVVYAYSLNDPQEYSFELDNLLAQIGQAEERYALTAASEQLINRSRFVRLVRYLASRDRGAQRAVPRIERDDPQFIALREGRFAEYFRSIHLERESWSPIGDGLDEMKTFADERGFALRAMIFPLLDQLARYPVRDVHAHLEREFDARGIPVLDLVGGYACLVAAGQPSIAADVLHPSAFGHAYASVALLDDLVRSGVVPALPVTAMSRLDGRNDAISSFARIARADLALRADGTSPCAADAFPPEG